MPLVVYRITSLLSTLLLPLPIGTNLALFHLLWMLMSGRLLESRGAIIPALAALGLAPDAVRRAWAAFAYGRWTTALLLTRFQQALAAEALWQPLQVGPYRPVAADLTAFFRPRLHGCSTKHYHPALGKEAPAIPLGVLARVGQVAGQRVPIVALLVRPSGAAPGTKPLQEQLLLQSGAVLGAQELLVVDAGFPLSQVQAAGVTAYLVRAAKNFVARRATLPDYKGRGRRPTRGARVRPLPRCRKGRVLPATPPDREEVWEENGVRVRARFFEELVRSDGFPGDPTFTCIVIEHPRYHQPLVLLTNQPMSGAESLLLYRARWAVEQVPLAAKQMLGSQRQYVFGAESRERLPELALLAGSLLTYVAATTEAIPTGFWDRRAQPTGGRLRRQLCRMAIPESAALPAGMRKKASVTEHLPKGVLGHRRQKKGAAQADALPRAA
jgi:hypothetical protein